MMILIYLMSVQKKKNKKVMNMTIHMNLNLILLKLLKQLIHGLLATDNIYCEVCGQARGKRG
jgi:hypothetical protein